MYLFVLYVFIALIRINNCDNYTSLTSFASNVIKRSNDVITCIRYIRDNDDNTSSVLSNVIERSIMDIELSSIIVSYEYLIKRETDNFCNVHVIICHDFRDCLIKYLKDYNYFFKPFSNIFIVTAVVNDNTIRKAKRLLSIYAFDIILIEGNHLNKETEIVKQLKFAKENRSLKVTFKSLVIDDILAEWNDGKGIIIRKHFDINGWQPRLNYDNGNGSIIALTADCPPFVYCDKSQPYEGVDYRIFMEITKNLRTNVTCVQKADDSYKVIVRDVKNKLADVCFCSLWSTMIGRDEFVFTKPYAMMCASFLVPKPHPLPDATFVFQPFQSHLWMFSLFILLAASTIFYTTDRINYEMNNERMFTSYNKSLLETLRILTMGSINLSPRQKSFRFIIVLWWYFAILLSTSYSAGITSALTFPRYTQRINTLSDMAENGIKWGSNVSSMALYYKRAPNKIINKVGNNWLPEYNNEQKLKRIKRNNYATLVKLLPARYVSDTDLLDDYAKNNLKTLNDCIGKYPLAFVLQEYTHYSKIFDNGIESLVESGIIDYWYSIVRHKYGLRYLENFFYVIIPKKYVQLKMAKLMGIFYLYMTGNVIAILSFIIEHVWHCYIAK